MAVAHFGELAALTTACCWTVTGLSFEAAGKRVGSLSVNLIRLFLALGFLTLFGLITRGRPLPLDAPAQAWLWLGLSGLIGFSIGDLCLFRAYVLVGSRVSMLLMALVPPMVALIGRVFLNETLMLRDWIGMAITVGGVGWVILEGRGANAAAQAAAEPALAAAARGRAARAPAGAADRDEVGGTGFSGEFAPVALAISQKLLPAAVHHDKRWRGVLLALVGAISQAVGLVFSKRGMGDYNAFASTQIRIILGIAGFIVIFFLTHWWQRAFQALFNRPAMVRIGLGAFFGPFLGVSFSLLAVQHTQAGIAATIMALVPVFIILPSVLVFHEKVSTRAIIGACLAVAGTALLFL